MKSSTAFLSVVVASVLAFSATAAPPHLETKREACSPAQPCLRPLPPPPPRLQPESSPPSAAREFAAKQIVKQVAKKAAGLGGGIAVDLMWPTRLDYEKTSEDPSSTQFKANREKLRREAEAQRRSR